MNERITFRLTEDGKHLPINSLTNDFGTGPLSR